MVGHEFAGRPLARPLRGVVCRGAVGGRRAAVGLNGTSERPPLRGGDRGDGADVILLGCHPTDA